MVWECWPLRRFTGSCMAQSKQSKLAFVLLSVCFFPPDLWLGGEEENAQSLWKVVEAHGHADVAGEADVNAEVDQPLLARA